MTIKDINRTVVSLPRLLAASALVCALTAAGHAQRQQQQSPPQQDVRVYVPELTVKNGTPSGAEVELAKFATSMLRLQLTSLKGLTVVDGGAAGCTPPAAEQPAAQPQADTPAVYYEVKTSIEKVEKQSDGDAEFRLVLSYELVKYVKCATRTLTDGMERFKEEDALQSLRVMGDSIELALEEELSRPKTVVGVAAVTGGNDANQQVRSRLADRLVFKLAELEDVQTLQPGADNSARHPADYEIVGTLGGDNRTVTFGVKKLPAGKPSFPNVTVTSRHYLKDSDEEKLIDFYEEAAAKAVGLLKSVRLADELVNELSLPVELTEEAINKASRRVAELLCMGQPDGCHPQAESAITILLKLTEKKPGRTPERLALLGEARKLIEDYLGAAQSYDEAGQETAPVVERIKLIILAAENWYEAKNYDFAAARYEEVIRLHKAEKTAVPITVYLQLMQSHIFAGDRVKALGAAIAGMRDLKDSPDRKDDLDELDDKFENLLGQLKVDELVRAAPLMEQNEDLVGVEDEMSSFQKRLVKRLLEAATLAYEEQNFAAMQDAIKQLFKQLFALLSREGTQAQRNR